MHCVFLTQRFMDPKTEPTIQMKLQFFIRYHTNHGDSLWLSGDTEELGMNDPARALPMDYLNDQFWETTISIDKKELQKKGLRYKYYLKNKEGEWIGEWGHTREMTEVRKNAEAIQLLDTWNHAGDFENAFFTAP